MDYKIVEVSLLSNLAALVRVELARGWEPLGGPFVYQDYGQCYGQAMVKKL